MPLISLLPILIGIYDIYFRGILLTEIIKWTVIGLLLQIGGAVLMIFITERVGEVEADSSGKDDWRKFTEEIFKAKGWHQLMIAIIMTVTIEELIFRGPIYIAMLFLELPALTWFLITIIDGVIFGLVHFKEDSSVPGFFSRSWAGIVLSSLVIKSGSLIPSICVHMLWSGFFLGIYYLAEKTSK